MDNLLNLLTWTGIYEKLKKQFDNNELEDEELILKKLQEEGIVDNILENLSSWDKDNWISDVQEDHSIACQKD